MLAACLALADAPTCDATPSLADLAQFRAAIDRDYLNRVGGATDLAVDAAIAGVGIVALVEGWRRRHLDSGALEPVLEPWWQPFSGPFLYYVDRRLVPPPLRAFIDFIKKIHAETPARTARAKAEQTATIGKR